MSRDMGRNIPGFGCSPGAQGQIFVQENFGLIMGVPHPTFPLKYMLAILSCVSPSYISFKSFLIHFLVFVSSFGALLVPLFVLLEKKLKSKGL